MSGTEEDEEKGDKKTVRQILSQLLSNNQPSNQVLICNFAFRHHPCRGINREYSNFDILIKKKTRIPATIHTMTRLEIFHIQIHPNSLSLIFQNGMIIVGGVIPVVVFAGEIGSVIAATLASVQYQRQLQSLLVQSQAQP